LFFGFIKKKEETMGKVFEYNKDNNEMWDVMPTMNDVEYELYLIETVKVMKLARNLLNEHTSDIKDIYQDTLTGCLIKLQEQINTAEETILQFEIDIEEMAKHYGQR
tara:strand:+ start:9 stop:329 length:321 start_codon:yes stop_codon:yes gene_type:complete